MIKKIIEIIKQLNELFDEFDKTTKKFQKLLSTFETCFIRIISLVGWIIILIYTINNS